MRWLFAIIFLICPNFYSWAQESGDAFGPKVSGSINILLAQGRLEGEVCLSEFGGPAPLEFLLNKGLNIKGLKTLEGQRIWYMGWHSLAQGEMVGEGIKYTVQLSKDVSSLSGFCIEYVGAFPIYADGEQNVSDNNGLNVFQPDLFRGTEQSKWLPNTYDSKTEIEGFTYRYDLEINCSDCSQIYLNGSGVKPGPKAHFQSEIPREMAILAGHLEVTNFETVTFLNLKALPEDLEKFLAVMDRISSLHQEYTGLEMKEKPVFFGMKLIAPWSKFSFASWPTIGLGDVTDVSGILSEEDGKLVQWIGQLLAHEMGHYYFGTVFKNPGPLNGIYGESFTEFFSLKFLKEEYGQKAFDAEIEKKRAFLQHWESWKPLDEVAGFADTDYFYRYIYVPLLFLYLDQTKGKEWFGRFTRETLKHAGKESVGFEFFKNTLLDSGFTSEEWDHFEMECLKQPPLEGCLKIN